MSKKILVIEDEPDIRKTLEYNLERENFIVTSASSLSDAKEHLAKDNFSLLILD